MTQKVLFLYDYIYLICIDVCVRCVIHYFVEVSLHAISSLSKAIKNYLLISLIDFNDVSRTHECHADH